jgi:hypothetical protein
MKTLDNFELISTKKFSRKVWDESWDFVGKNTMSWIVSETNIQIFRFNRRNVEMITNQIHENFEPF